MAGGANNKRGIITGINVTPLVDITLVLLVVFMVTAQISVTSGLPVDLPQASQGQEVQVIFSVVLPTDGTITVNGTPLASHEALEARAREALDANAELRAVIEADGGVSHRDVMAVLDTLRAAGIARVAFGTQPELSPEVVTP